MYMYKYMYKYMTMYMYIYKYMTKCMYIYKYMTYVHVQLTSFESHVEHVFSPDGSGICVYRQTGHLCSKITNHVTIT